MEELIRKHLPQFLEKMQPHLEELYKLNFSFANPVFDFSILVLLLVLAKLWGFKKSLSYCLLVSAILSVASIINNSLKTSPVVEPELASIDIFMFIVLVVVGIITIYYLFLKNE